jgi:hypothetical protein
LEVFDDLQGIFDAHYDYPIHNNTTSHHNSEAPIASTSSSSAVVVKLPVENATPSSSQTQVTESRDDFANEIDEFMEE